MASKKITVLAIEDDPGDIHLLRRCLEDIPGWEGKFLAFTEPADALTQLSQHAPDVILLDYVLGATTGLEVLKTIQRYGCKCPVVILTGHGDEELAAELMRFGAADYLPKNRLSRNSLKRVISNVMANHKLQEALEEHRQRLEEVNQDLLRKNQEIRGFYHRLSGKLADPVTSVRGHLSMVLAGSTGPLTYSQRKYLKIAKENCDQICFYINDLVEVTTLLDGKHAINPCPVSIGELVHRVVASMSPAAQEKGIRLKHIIQPDLPEAWIDENRIAQVLSNLLSNALKFTPEGGEIMVRVADNPISPEFVLVSVRDTGRGIERDKLPYIFDRLYQATSSDWMTHRGLGLSLYICRELVRLHGGDISAHSEPGKGSTFVFSIPKHAPREASDTTMEKEGAYEKDPRG